MELQIPSFPALLIAFLFSMFIILYKVIKKSKPKNSAPKLPPGPWKLPLIGNIHQLIGTLPHRSLNDLAMKHGPLMHLQLGQVSSIVVSSSEITKEVFKTHDINFSQRPHFLATKIVSYDNTDILFSPYGDYWRLLRKICMMELLSPMRVQSFRSIREEEISNLIENLTLNAGTPGNLSEKILGLTYSITSRAAFGKRCKDQEAFISFIKEAGELALGFTVADMYPSVKLLLALVSGMKSKLKKMHQEADEMLENIINEH